MGIFKLSMGLCLGQRVTDGPQVFHLAWRNRRGRFPRGWCWQGEGPCGESRYQNGFRECECGAVTPTLPWSSALHQGHLQSLPTVTHQHIYPNCRHTRPRRQRTLQSQLWWLRCQRGIRNHLLGPLCCQPREKGGLLKSGPGQGAEARASNPVCSAPWGVF